MLPVSRPVLRTISHSTPEIGDGWSNTLHSSFEPETCPGIHRATRVDRCQLSPSLSRPIHIWWHGTSSWFVCCCSQCKGAKRLVGPEWRSVSRAAHDMLSLRACLSHLPTQYAESARLMFDLLKHPKVSHRSATLKWVHLKSLCQNFHTHINRYSGSVFTAVIYGIHSPGYEGRLLQKIQHFIAKYKNAFNLCDNPPIWAFSFLTYLPEYLRRSLRIQEARREQSEIFFGLFDIVAKRIKNRRQNGCLLEDIIDRQEHYRLDRQSVAYVLHSYLITLGRPTSVFRYLGGSLLQVGHDITASFLRTFIAFMAAYPEVQQRAQQEIDDVIGLDRLPKRDDFDKLLYLRAVVNEVWVHL